MSLVFYRVSWRRRGFTWFMGKKMESLVFKSADDAQKKKNELMSDAHVLSVSVEKVDYSKPVQKPRPSRWHPEPY